MAEETNIAEWHKDIFTCPLTKFVECAVDNNLHALVISGNPRPEELLEAWLEIQGQYADSIGDEEHSLYLSLLRRVSVLQATLTEIQTLVQILYRCYVKHFADELNRLLFTSFVFDVKDPELYDKNLQRCLNRSKGIKVDLDLKMAQFEAIQQKHEGEEKKVTREYFQSILITISDAAGYLLPDTITVFQFCERVKRFNKQEIKNTPHGAGSK